MLFFSYFTAVPSFNVIRDRILEARQRQYARLGSFGQFCWREFDLPVYPIAVLSHKETDTAAMTLSARMRVDPGARVSLAIDFVKNTVQAKWSQKELDAVSGFFFAYQEFTGKEGLKLGRELSIIDHMRLPIPREVLLRNPLVQFGITKGRQEGRHQGEIDLVLRMLKRRMGPVSVRQRQAIRRLSRARVEALGEALLDFRTSSDLSQWLKSHAS